jgi:hypothetical protein
MTDEKKSYFKEGVLKAMEEMPDATHQAICDLTMIILKAAAIHNGQQVDRNITFAALQRSLSVIISCSFSEDLYDTICTDVAEAMRKTIKDFREKE